MNGQQYTQSNEGCRLTAYQDQGGVWTIGYGCTGPTIGPHTVWTQEQADDQFAFRYAQAQKSAAMILGAGSWAGLDEVRQAALTDMAYQLGGVGLSRFVHMLAAVRAQAWQMAHDQCLESQYAIQTPARCQRSATMLLFGLWPSMNPQPSA